MAIRSFDLVLIILTSVVVSNVSSESDEKISLTFVIDKTSSMSIEINATVAGAKDIFETIANSNESPVDNYVLVTFGDSDVSSPIITKDTDEFKRALDSIELDTDEMNDCPEASMGGIKKALEASLPGSYLYVFTDASAKDSDIYDEVKNLAQQKRCQVVFVLTGHCAPQLGNDNVYYKLAETTSGQVFDVNKQKMKKILKYVEESIATRRVNILSRKYPPGTHILHYVSDPRTRNTLVAISGSYLKAEVRGPDGEIVPSYIVHLNKVLIFKVDDVNMNGDYFLNFTSNTTACVVVSATSDVRFYHGFSTAEPSSFNDTAYKPFPDVKNYLTIKIFGENVTPRTVQFFNSNYHNLSLEIPLTIHKDKKLYITGIIDPPQSPFRIAVKGDVDNTTIRRFGNMLLKSDTYVDKIPTVSIEGDLKIKLNYDEPLKLTGIIDAFPKPNIIIWKDADGIPLSTTVIQEPPYKYIVSLELQHVKKNNAYECFATNKMGNGSKVVQVEVLQEHFLKFLERPKSIEVDIHSEAVLHCTADGYPPAKIKWRTRIKRQFFQLSPDNSTLTIKRMHPLAQGFYVCIAENIEKKKRSRVKITISASSATKPKIDKTTFEVRERENSSPTLTCHLLEGKPEPSIRWYRQYSSSNARIEIEHGRNSTTISLFKVNRYETGTYTCEAKNVMGEDTHTLFFFVDYPPIIVSAVKSIKAKKGEEIYIKLPVEGSPTPDYIWQKDGKSIGNDIHLYKDNSFKVNADFSHGGIYTCTATNALGSAKQSLEVIIYTLVIKPPLEPIVVEEKEPSTIVCEAEGVPEPTFTWTFSSSDKSVPAETLPFTGSSIKINKANRSQSGNYICTASNIGGSQDILYRVDVLYEPYIQVDRNEYKAIEGENFNQIHCSATGNPKPDIGWTKNGATLSDDSRYNKNDGWLNITDVQISDDGLYSCTANNNIGFPSSSPFKVKVGTVPTFVVTQNHYTAIKLEFGQSDSLNCEATGKPEPTVMWRHNNVIMNFSKTVFHFNMDTKTIGNYSCMVSNKIGNISRTYHLSLKGCVLQINKDSRTQPLILTTSGKWPPFKIVKELMFVPTGQDLLFSCPKLNIKAQCAEGTKLIVDGGLYDYTDIKCNENIKSSINHTKIACLGKETKLFRYVLDTSDKSIQLYEVCVNKHNFPIYTKHIMRNPAGNSPKDSLSSNLDLDKKLYTCAKQKTFFPPKAKIIISATGNCCFAKRPLVNPKDLYPGPAQRTFLTQVNTVPHWSSCHGENWNEVEERVRKLSESIDEDLIVYTGTARHWKFPVQSHGKTTMKPLYLGSQPIYEYLWKVIQYPAGGSSLAIIQLNKPGVKPSEVEVHCRDICKDAPWMNGSNWKIMEKGHVVCCDLRDFEMGYNYSNIFEPGLNKRLDVTI